MCFNQKRLLPPGWKYFHYFFLFGTSCIKQCKTKFIGTPPQYLLVLFLLEIASPLLQTEHKHGGEPLKSHDPTPKKVAFGRECLWLMRNNSISQSNFKPRKLGCGNHNEEITSTLSKIYCDIVPIIEVLNNYGILTANIEFIWT